MVEVIKSALGSVLVWNDDVIIDVGQDFVMTLSHNVRDGIGDQLKSWTPMDPAKSHPFTEEILTLPFYAKFQCIRGINSKIPESSSNIDFGELGLTAYAKTFLGNIINGGEL